MILFTLDPAPIRSGYAYGAPGGPITCGSILTGERDEPVPVDLLAFDLWFLAEIARLKPIRVGYYAAILARHDDALSIRRKFGQTGIIDLECRRNKIPCTHSADGTVVAWLTGRARWGIEGMNQAQRRKAKKDAVKRAVARYGVDHRGDEDAADAAALFFYIENKLFPREFASRGLVLREAS